LGFFNAEMHSNKKRFIEANNHRLHIQQIMKLLIAIIIAALSSCTLTVNPDGSRTYGTDATTAAIIAAQIVEAESGK